MTAMPAPVSVDASLLLPQTNRAIELGLEAAKLAMEAQRQRDALLSALRNLKEQLTDEIDGAEESRGRDTRITGLIAICDEAIAKGSR